MSLATKGKKHTHPHRAGQGQGRVGQGGTKENNQADSKAKPSDETAYISTRVPKTGEQNQYTMFLLNLSKEIKIKKIFIHLHKDWNLELAIFICKEQTKTYT
jgi:hypothetical protein